MLIPWLIARLIFSSRTSAECSCFSALRRSRSAANSEARDARITTPISTNCIHFSVIVFYLLRSRPIVCCSGLLNVLLWHLFYFCTHKARLSTKLGLIRLRLPPSLPLQCPQYLLFVTRANRPCFARCLTLIKSSLKALAIREEVPPLQL